MARKPAVQPHVQLRKLLGNAKGEPEFVIAAVLDIRGFSSFAMKVDSVQAAAYLRRVYMKRPGHLSIFDGAPNLLFNVDILGPKTGVWRAISTARGQGR